MCSDGGCPSRPRSAAMPPEPPPDAAALVSLSTVEPAPVRWLWPGYIPLGKLTVLDGDPALGKSTLLLDLAARVSTGAPMPDGSPGLHAPVCLLSAEDALADTIRPRLVAPDPDDRALRVLACTKVNLAAPPTALRFALVPEPSGVCRIDWRGPTDLQADDLLRPPAPADEAGALDEACRVLTDLLRDGP